MKIDKNSKEFFRMILAVVMIIGFFGVLISMMLMDNKFEGAVLTMVGALTGAVLTIINYEWGSSKSSADKNDIIDKINNQPPA